MFRVQLSCLFKVYILLYDVGILEIAVTVFIEKYNPKIKGWNTYSKNIFCLFISWYYFYKIMMYFFILFDIPLYLLLFVSK